MAKTGFTEQIISRQRKAKINLYIQSLFQVEIDSLERNGINIRIRSSPFTTLVAIHDILYHFRISDIIA
jgi:hypothetical protein